MQDRAPGKTATARLFCLAAGALLTLLGVGGLLWEADFATGEGLIAGEAFGVFDLNGWTNVLHLGLGLAALALASQAPAMASGAIGVVLLLLAFVGLGAAEDGEAQILDLFATNPALSVLHLALGLAGVTAFAAVRRRGSADPAA